MSRRISQAWIVATAKCIAEFWDNHCSCPSKQFPREKYLEQIISGVTFKSMKEIEDNEKAITDLVSLIEHTHCSCDLGNGWVCSIHQDMRQLMALTGREQ